MLKDIRSKSYCAIMINFVDELPEKVVCIEVTGDISKEEYDSKIVPRL